ncbi:MAG: topoisomerase C-terminal repeat-containing protein, partial [SAR324 cluster bacterium]|nr:topoisomerase C-terminal repeat-containing protein [SAR324 cluster bacterium]
ELLSRCDQVINCGDAGQEGELIVRRVLTEAGYTKPHKRLWISSLTSEAIKSGFANLHDSKAFDRLFGAAKLRAVGDWLFGMNGSRAYTKKFGGFGNVLSVGRVQTPTLSILVERQKEIDNFKPEKYWQLTTKYRKTKFLHQQKRFNQKTAAEAVQAEITGKPLTITRIEKKDQKIHPPKLFDLTTLQVEANRKFGFSADKTLKIAQQLYENKQITYPRVDSQYLSGDVYKNTAEIVKTMLRLSRFQFLKESILKDPESKSRYVNDKKVTDHHAIIPTGQKVLVKSEDETKILGLIIRRFLAIFLPAALEQSTKVSAIIGKHGFNASGKILKEQGWKTVYQVEEEKVSKEQIIPDFEKGESGPHKSKIEEKETIPPKKYTEGGLLKTMETCGKMVDDEELRDAMKEKGIGRPSTRAAIIETLLSRQYIKRVKKTLVPTEKGIYLIHCIQNDTLTSPVLTGKWEFKLRLIEKDEYKPLKFYNELLELVSTVVDEVKQVDSSKIEKPESFENPDRSADIKGIGPCPKCKSGVVMDKNKAFGCSEWKNSGCDFTIWKEISGKKISETQVKTLIKKGRTKLLKGFVSKKKTKFDAALILDQAFKVTFEFE